MASSSARRSPVDTSGSTNDSPPSDDIIVEEMKSGLRTVQAVAEQLSVEKESAAVLDLISQTEEAVRRIDTLNTSAQKWARVLRRPQSAKPNKDVVTTLISLGDTSRQVQELHIATLQRQVKRSVTLGALEYLEDIKIALRALLDHLSSPKADGLPEAFSRFASQAGKWLRSSGNDTFQPIVVSSAVASSSLMNSAASASSSTVMSPSSKDSCPLETAMRSASIFGHLLNNLSGFVEWAMREKSFSEVHSLVGPVRSVHLYREREAPLHHEFALISFGKTDEPLPSSWMRVERAALLKSKKLRPKWDSFGPIFQGAPLRETVTVAASKESLAGRANELAAVTIPSFDKQKGTAPFFLDELARQLLNTSGSRPQYQLLTANCRWFARSTLLTSAQRFSQTPVTVYSWHGSDVPYDTIYAKLLEDRFGGKQLEGPRAELLTYANKIEELATSLLNSKPKRVITSTDALIEGLEKVAEDSSRKTYLIAYATYLRGTALRMLNHFSDALTPLERARDLLQPIRTESNDYELLHLDIIGGIAIIRYVKKDFESARVLRAEIVDGWRKQRELYSDIDSALGLGRALGFYARTLPGLRSETRDEEARTVIDEAEQLARSTHERRDDLAAELLAWVLSQKAGILADTSTDKASMEAALAASTASVEQTRTLYAQKPDMMRRPLAARLLVSSKLATRLQEFDAACQASRQSLELYRILYGTAPRSFAVDLQKNMLELVKLVRCVSNAAAASEGLESIQRVVQSLRALYDAEGGDIHRQVLVFFLEAYAHLLGKTRTEVVAGLGSHAAERESLIREIETKGGKFTGKPKIITDL